jgi:hypothetical protein
MEKFVQIGGPNGFVVRKIVVPPIEVDCSEFIDRSEGEWVVGNFVKNNLIVPPITVNCSEAEPPQPPVEPSK